IWPSARSPAAAKSPLRSASTAGTAAARRSAITGPAPPDAEQPTAASARPAAQVRNPPLMITSGSASRRHPSKRSTNLAPRARAENHPIHALDRVRPRAAVRRFLHRRPLPALGFGLLSRSLRRLYVEIEIGLWSVGRGHRGSAGGSLPVGAGGGGPGGPVGRPPAPLHEPR